MPRALRDGVGFEREDEPAECRRSRGQRELPEPEVGETACGQVGQQQEQVPSAHVAEERIERPEDEPERPAAEVPARRALWPEGVRVAPRRAAVVELVPDEPEVVLGLQVVARRRLAGHGGPAREEARPRVRELRRHRQQPGAEVERDEERYKARAAESSSSKSGTSAASYRHAPRTVPPRSTRKAVRSAISLKPRNSCATPNACTASAFQSESSGKFRSSACIQEMCVQGESREMPIARTPACSNFSLLSRRSSSSLVQVADQSKR